MLRITFALTLIARAAAAASQADLSLDLTLPAKLPNSQPVLYGSVRNLGPDAAENVVVTATTSTGQHFEIPLGTVYPIEGRPVLLKFPAEDAAFRLEARVSSTTRDPDAVNDYDSGSVEVTSAPKLRFFFDFPTADPGQPVVYEVQVYNDSAGDALNVSFDVPIDDGWTLGESLSPRMQCAPVAGEQARCTIERIAAGDSFDGHFTLRAPNRPEGEAPRVLQVSITSDRGTFDSSPASFVRGIYRHLTVTSTADDGAGSLRAAIAAVKTPPKTPTKIDFDIPLVNGERVATIRPLTPLPAVTSTVALFIDGTTQTAARGDTNPDGPEIEINGANLTAGSGLESSMSLGALEIRGLIVNGFPGSGIAINSGAGRINGCYVGTDATGRHAVPNGGRGISINSSADIRDSVISGNGRSGIFAPTGGSIVIANNRIGVAAGDALLPLGNGASGIFFGSQTNQCSAIGNLIGFNRDAGIALDVRASNITMSANAIADNGGLPIDYGIDGVTANGTPHVDLPRFPILTASRYDAETGKTIVEGRSDESYVGIHDTIELFASETGEPRQAAQFLGRVLLRNTGKLDFHFEYDGDLRGRFITATFTEANSYYPEAYGDRTSEVSAPIAVAGEPAAPLRRIPRGADVKLNFGGEYQLTRLHAGDTSLITFSYGNSGPKEARDIAVTIDIQNATSVRLFDGRGDGACQQSGNTRIVCTTQRLAPGASFSSSFSVKTPLQSGTVSLSASLTSSTEDPDRSNNSGKIVLEVNDAPVVYVGVSNVGPVEPGGKAVYRLTVQDSSALPVTDVALAITMAPGWSFVDSDGDWQCTPQPTTLVCKRPRMEAAEQDTLTLTLRALASPDGQRRIANPIRITTARPMAFDTTAYLITEVIRHYEVTITADDGAGSLRDVINRANRECPRDQVTCEARFNLPLPVPAEGWYSIRPRTPLPPITAGLIIDATTQTGITGDTNPLGPEVELNGSALAIGNGVFIHTMQVSGVRGLAINRFPENGVMIDQFDGAGYGLQRVIADCYIGTDPTGRAAAPNALRGIAIVIDPRYGAGVNVFDNVISGNGRSGIYVSGGSGVHISNNRIGVAAGTGLDPLGNGASGVYLGSSSSAQVNQNVIAFNRDVGIGSDLAASYIDVQRNVITANGSLAIDYGLDGVTFNDSTDRPAELPRYPTITSARWDAAAGVTRIEGIAPPSRYTRDRGLVDVYRNSSVDARGFGPAEEWLGEVILEPSSEPRPFVLTVPRNLQGNFVAATFTRGFAILPWTSELSATVPVTP